MSGIGPTGDVGIVREPAGEEPHASFERRPSRLPFFILGAVVLLTLGSLGYTMFMRSVVYYRTPTEVAAQPGVHTRLSGTVVDGSIDLDPAAGSVSFDATDGRTTIPVVFYGPAPDTLKDGAEAVAEGRLGEDGVFQAETLFAKCPSKFESEEAQ